MEARATDSEDVPLHPHPQRARRRWIDLCGRWEFAYDDADVGAEEHWQDRSDVFDLTIVVPFPPESAASGIGDRGFHPVVWYRRTFEVSPLDAGKHLILHCGAIDYRATVWVNGTVVAAHEGGHTPFATDITTALRPGGEQIIVIRAEDQPHDLAQPRGKQDWQAEPHQIWYPRTTGIWQPIWLEPVAPSHLVDVRWTPDADRVTLGFVVTVARPSPSLAVRVLLSLHDQVLASDVYQLTGDDSLEREIALDRAAATMSRESMLWSPGFPNVIEATITLLDDGVAVDELFSYTGLRSVGVADGRFVLNGRPYFLRLALAQGYWPRSHLAAPDDEALRREVELAKELGFNGLRIHQKVEDPRFLYWCDRLGLLVWGEMPNAYVFSRPAVERLTAEWIEVIRRDASHPCIVAWVPINESWGVPNLPVSRAQQDFVRTLYHLTRTLDPTRPVVANDGWEFVCGDIAGLHDYTFEPNVIRERYGSGEAIARTMRELHPAERFLIVDGTELGARPVVLSEFGGISYRPEGSAPWYGYGTVGSRDEFQERYRALIEAVLDCPTIAGFCYTQLTDTAQETNGLLTEDREFKLDVDAVRAITRRPPSWLITGSLQRGPFPA